MTHPLARTGRSIVAGTWGCAAITMAGSAASAAVAYDYLGEHWGLGLATGIAVDIALCVGLVGDRQLYLHGMSSHWGRALRVTTAVMSLVLNSGVAFAQGRYFLAFLHAFLPVLLVVLTEYGQDVLLKFTALAQQRAATEHSHPTPAPVAGALQQLHRPPAPPPVTAAPADPPPPALPVPTADSSPVVTSRGDDSSPPLDTRLRGLIERTGRIPGRRTVATELGISEHHARVLLDNQTSPKEALR